LRAKWFFSIAYLADRAEEYVPVGWVNRLAKRVPALRWLYRRVIPLNLYDSYVVLLRKKSEGLDE